MARSLEASLERLEMLYTEQDHTLGELNRVVAQQDRELSRLRRSVEHLEARLATLRAEYPNEIDPQLEKPPHY